MGSRELTEAVRPDEDCVAGVDDARFDDARYDGANEGDREGVVDVEFEGGVGVVIAVVRKDVEECADKVQGLASDVGDLEDGADALRDELGGGLDSVGAIFDEDGYFPCTRRLEYASQLGDGLLQNLRRAYVNLCNDYHHRNIQGEGDSEMLSRVLSASVLSQVLSIPILAHSNQTIIGSDHKQAVIRAAAQETKDCSP